MKPLKTQRKNLPGIAAITKPASVNNPILQALFAEIDSRRLTQESVANAIGVSYVTLSNWKHGHSNPTLFNTEAFAQVLGCRLFLGKQDMKTECIHYVARELARIEVNRRGVDWGQETTNQLANAEEKINRMTNLELLELIGEVMERK